MFIKNSVIIFSFLMCLFPFTLIPKKIELLIPKLNYQTNIDNINRIEITENIEYLCINDRIVIKDNKETSFYKVIGIYYLKDNESHKNYLANEATIVLKSENKINGLHLVVVAINTGKIVQN